MNIEVDTARGYVLVDSTRYIEAEPLRDTCDLMQRLDYCDGEIQLWYKCGFMICVTEGSPEPICCPGCGKAVVTD